MKLLQRFFVILEGILRWVTAYPVFPLQVLFLLLASCGLIGDSFGLEQLIWSEKWNLQLSVGFGLGLHFGMALFVLYLLNPPRELTNWLRPLKCSYTPGFYLFSRSKHQEVQRLGAYLTFGLILLFVLLFLPKLVRAVTHQQPYLYMKDRNYFLWLALGYALSVVFAYIIYKLDEHFEIRKSIVESRYFQRLPYVRKAALPPEERPTDRLVATPESQPVHGIAVLLFGVSVVMLVGIYFLVGVQNRTASSKAVLNPVLAGCVFLIIFNLLYGVIAFHLHMQRLIVGGAVLLLFLWNSTLLDSQNAYRSQFPGLNYDPNQLVRLQTTEGKDNYAELLKISQPFAEKELLKDEAILEKMCMEWQKGHPGKKKPKIIVYAVSGGGMRAAVWTATVLEQLEQEIPGLRANTRLFTGASGGMLAAAFYIADYEQNWVGRGVPQASGSAGIGSSPMLQALSKETLSPVVQTMVLQDLTMNLLVPPGFAPAYDRGLALEDKWHQNSLDVGYQTSPLKRTLKELRKLEAEGKRPSFIFSPMMVEDARRLFISNLDLQSITQPRFDSLDGEGRNQVRALTAVEFQRLFPAERGENFSIGTAARMSATFPYVSPAAALPTVPPRRLIDAGMFDNYGISVLTAWLLKNEAALRMYTDGVAIVEVRAFPLEETHRGFTTQANYYESNTLETQSEMNWQHRLNRDLQSAPVSAIMHFREHSAFYRNAQDLASLRNVFGKKGGLPDNFLQNVVFEMNSDAPVSWFLTERHQQQMKQVWENEMFGTEISLLKKWFNE